MPLTGTGADEADRCTEGGRSDAVSPAGEETSAQVHEVGHEDEDDDVPRESAHHERRRVQPRGGTRTDEAGHCG